MNDTPSKKASYIIRRATVDDVNVLARHRAAMFRDTGRAGTDTVAAMIQDALVVPMRTLLQDREYVAWIAVADESPESADTIIGSVAVHCKATLPRPSYDGQGIVIGPQLHVIDVYTHPLWRRKGIARALMRELLLWTRTVGVDKVTLHASATGKPLYEQLGFEPTTEMQWIPDRR